MCELESYDEIFTKIENGRITSNNNNYPEIITVENGRITEEVKQQIIQLDTQGVLPDQISLLLNLTKSCVHQFLKEYHQGIKNIVNSIEGKLVQQNDCIPIAMAEEVITTENPHIEFFPHLDAEQKDFEFDVDEFLSKIQYDHPYPITSSTSYTSKNEKNEKLLQILKTIKKMPYTTLSSCDQKILQDEGINFSTSGSLSTLQNKQVSKLIKHVRNRLHGHKHKQLRKCNCEFFQLQIQELNNSNIQLQVQLQEIRGLLKNTKEAILEL